MKSSTKGIKNSSDKLTTVCFLCTTLLIITFSFSCGKFAPPIPPERTSPKFIEGFEAKQIESSKPNLITLNWNVPEVDQRGEKLKDLFGYRIYKKDVSEIDESCLKLIPPVVPAVVLDSSGSPIPTASIINTPTPTATPFIVATDGSIEKQIERQEMCLKQQEELKKKNFDVIETIQDVAISNLKVRKKEAREKGEISRKVKLLDSEKIIQFKDEISHGRKYAYKIVPYNSSYVELDPDILNVISIEDSKIVLKQFNNPQYESGASLDEGFFKSSEDEE